MGKIDFAQPSAIMVWMQEQSCHQCPVRLDLTQRLQNAPDVRHQLTQALDELAEAQAALERKWAAAPVHTVALERIAAMSAFSSEAVFYARQVLAEQPTPSQASSREGQAP